MQNKIKKLGFVNSLVFIAFLLLGGCNTNSKKGDALNVPEKGEKWRIVATTGMIKDAVMNIVVDRAIVEGLMGPGVDPHLYKATQGDLQKLVNADIVFYNGLHLEGKMQDIFEKMTSEKEVIAIADAIDKSRLIVTFDDGTNEASKTYDPHIWFDVSLWIEAAKNISEEMQRIDPTHAPLYIFNFKEYQIKLVELNKLVRDAVKTISRKQRLLITSHDAFGYFGKAYNIEVKGLQGISTVTEFGLRDVTKMVDLITNRKIKAIFVESSVASKPLEAVVAGCKERGHEIEIGGTLFSDAMGAEGTKEGTYIGMVEHNVKTIVEALK